MQKAAIGDSVLIVCVRVEGENPRAAAEGADWAVPAEGLVEEPKAATHVLRDGPLP